MSKHQLISKSVIYISDDTKPRRNPKLNHHEQA